MDNHGISVFKEKTQKKKKKKERKGSRASFHPPSLPSSLSLPLSILPFPFSLPSSSPSSFHPSCQIKTLKEDSHLHIRETALTKITQLTPWFWTFQPPEPWEINIYGIFVIEVQANTPHEEMLVIFLWQMQISVSGWLTPSGKHFPLFYSQSTYLIKYVLAGFESWTFLWQKRPQGECLIKAH